MLEKPLGKFIINQISEMEEAIEQELIKISINKEDWAIEIEYKFELNEYKEIRDSFIVQVICYIDDKKQGKFKFKFRSIESIFLSEICKVIYQITQDPKQIQRIIGKSKVTIKLLSYITYLQKNN